MHPSPHKIVSLVRVGTLSLWFILCPQLLEQCLVKKKG